MKKLFIILILLARPNVAIADSYIYGGIRKQHDYRFTTQQDRNSRIKACKNFLENTGIFEDSHRKHKKDFENFKEDKNYRDNIKFLKFDIPLPKKGYLIKGNYYLMADKVIANYSVIYENDSKNEYIYDLFGNLYEVKILTGDENIRPYFKATYSNTGYLQKVNFFAEDGFEYIFYADGKLQGVVVNDKLYNSIGRPVKVWLL